MAVPDYQTLMLPLLQVAADQQEHRVREVIPRLARQFGLTEDELAQLLPSGKQTTFSSRVHWAKTYLTQAGLLQSTERSHFKITDRGLEVLKEGPQRVDVQFLTRFPEFVDFRFRARSRDADYGSVRDATNQIPVPLVADASETPDEVLRTTARNIEAVLAKELLDRILEAPPAFF